MKNSFSHLFVQAFLMVWFICSLACTAQTSRGLDGKTNANTKANKHTSNLEGKALRAWLKKKHYDKQHRLHSYSDARKQMYAYIDNRNNKVRCVYSGYEVEYPYGKVGYPSKPINCEHTVPQSYYDKTGPMRSDLFHLFPTYDKWNGTRARYPFREIKDESTSKWMLDQFSQTNIPSSNKDAYSEYIQGGFEPPEAQKGNTARAIFYFFTMYPTQGGSINRVANINTLYQWHLNDPVDALEQKRNDLIEKFQGNRNPYIDDPSLVAIAWNLGEAAPTNPRPNSNKPTTYAPPTAPPRPSQPQQPDAPKPRTTSGTSTHTSLIFTVYVEGSSFNKALVVKNIRNQAVDLSGYKICKDPNGKGEWSKGIRLFGSLAAGASYVIVNEKSTASQLIAKASLTSKQQEMDFNGDDAIGLFYNNELVDLIGYFKEKEKFAENKTLVRKKNVQRGTTQYDYKQWLQKGKDEFDF